MDGDTVFRALMLLIAVPSATKMLHDIFVGSRSRLRDEYKFAREFLADVAANPAIHPFALEKGYQALAGDRLLKVEEASYLLTLKNSPKALRDFVLGHKYLEHLPHGGDLQINFRQKYRGKWARGVRMGVYFSLYSVFGVAALGPFFFASDVVRVSSIPAAISIAFGSLVIGGSYAWFSLKAGIRIARAVHLVRNQDKHTQRILLDSVQPLRQKQ